MKIINNLDTLAQLDYGTAIALGAFDGMHIGHQRVIKAMVDQSKKMHLKTLVYTFSNHPKSHHDPKGGPKRLMTPDQKAHLLQELGVDLLVQVPFDERQVNISALSFLEDILVGKLNVKHISVGYDFRFGKSALGNVAFLKNHKDVFGYGLSVVEPVKAKDQVVSSTLIRKHLLEGQVSQANALLGRVYSVEGHVDHGKKMGRKLGYPTANLKTEFEMSVLKPGVYISQVLWRGQTYNSVTNVGFNPTFDQEHFTIETYILDFDKDIYMENIQVLFLKYLRPEIKFTSLQDLIDKISQDVDLGREYFKKSLN